MYVRTTQNPLIKPQGIIKNKIEIPTLHPIPTYIHTDPDPTIKSMQYSPQYDHERTTEPEHRKKRMSHHERT